MRTYTREMQPEDFEQLVWGTDFSRVISIEDTRGQSLALDGYNLAASISLCEVNGLIYSNENDDDFTFIKSAFDPILQEAITTIPELESISKLALPE